MQTTSPLIEIRGLTTTFQTRQGAITAVDGIDLTIPRESTLGLVGESGCGKSVTALSIMGLLPTPTGRVAAGSVVYHRNGQRLDLALQDPRGPVMRSIRGNEIAMIFQEPMTSLNPVYTIGRQLTEAIRLHQKVNAGDARSRAMEMLESVGVSAPAQRLREYPHELSGGMRQRVMIGMALSCHPSLLIADEPTTALDVTIQAQVLTLMRRLKQSFQASILFITHDLGVIAQMADAVAVMYLGRIVEHAPVKEIFGSPSHPYTRGLLSSTPSILRPVGEPLQPIEGTVPAALDSPAGCVFADRCPVVMDVCRSEVPGEVEIAPFHQVRCWRHLPGGTGL